MKPTATSSHARDRPTALVVKPSRYSAPIVEPTAWHPRHLHVLRLNVRCILVKGSAWRKRCHEHFFRSIRHVNVVYLIIKHYLYIYFYNYFHEYFHKYFHEYFKISPALRLFLRRILPPLHAMHLSDDRFWTENHLNRFHASNRSFKHFSCFISFLQISHHAS